jgi:hypothetical protein
MDHMGSSKCFLVVSQIKIYDKNSFHNASKYGVIPFFCDDLVTSQNNDTLHYCTSHKMIFDTQGLLWMVFMI